jgi:hypothetical protein
MRIRSFITAAVIVALGSAIVSPSAWAGENPNPVTTPHVDFQKAIAHAVEQAPSLRRDELSQADRANQPLMQRGYGGGGGHMMMVMSVVGMVAGIGMTYYMIKQMRKITDQAAQGQ